VHKVTTHYTTFNPTYKHVHSNVTYLLRVYQFTVRQVGKGGENVIVINQVVTHYPKFNPDVCTSMSIQGTYLLSMR